MIRNYFHGFLIRGWKTSKNSENPTVVKVETRGENIESGKDWMLFDERVNSVNDVNPLKAPGSIVVIPFEFNRRTLQKRIFVAYTFQPTKLHNRYSYMQQLC